jgi:hypothetical protein
MKQMHSRLLLSIVCLLLAAGSALQAQTKAEQQADRPLDPKFTRVNADPEAPQKPVRAAEGVVIAAPVPRLVKFSGALKDASGEPRTGVVGITFAIYAEEFEGSPLWMETHNAELDELGRYSVLLGATQAAGIPLELFAAGEPRWLGIQAQLSGETEQQRVLLVSVPYALKAADADTLGGKPASAFLLREPSEATESEVAVKESEAEAATEPKTENQVTGTGTTNVLAKWTGPTSLGSSAASESGGALFVGMGGSQSNVVVNGLKNTWSGFRLDHASGERWFLGFDPFLEDGNLQIRSEGVANRVTITSGGMVGIGTSSPHAPLTVGAGVGQSNVVVNGQATTWSGFRLDNGSSETWFLGFDATLGEGNLQFRSDASENRMTITRSGNVGIGTTTPAAKLDVVGSVRSNNLTFTSGTGAMIFHSGNNRPIWQHLTTSGPFLQPDTTTREIFHEITTSRMHWRRVFIPGNVFNPTVINTYMVVDFDAGTVGIGTVANTDRLEVLGDIRVGTSGTNGCLKRFDGTALTGSCASDARLKKNVQPLLGVLTRIAALRPVTFLWRSEEFPERALGNTRNLGLIAQEVEQVMPELVGDDGKGFKAIHYHEIPILLLQAVRELKAERDALQRQVQEQEERLRQIEARLETNK